MIDDSIVLTERLIPQDKYDDFLLSDILLMVQNTITIELIKWWVNTSTRVEKGEEMFLRKIFLVVTNLFKFNAHRRNFYRVQDDLLKKLKNDSAIIGTNVDVIFESVDAYVEIDGFFTKAKTSLDLLAQSLKPIYGIEFQTWKRAKVGKTKKVLSGQQIINSLEKIKQSNDKSNTEDLLVHMKTHAPYITKIVKYRDDVTHYGESKNIKGFRYYVSSGKVTPPVILLSDTEVVYIHKYMDEVAKYLAEFTRDFLMILLSNLIPDMNIRKDPDGSWGWYSVRS